MVDILLATETLVATTLPEASLRPGGLVAMELHRVGVLLGATEVRLGMRLLLAEAGALKGMGRQQVGTDTALRRQDPILEPRMGQ